MKMATQSQENIIELRLGDSAKLFNTLDPFPFHERDISAEAEEYIVNWALDLPKDQPILIVIHLENSTSDADESTDLQEAIKSWFQSREAGESRAMKSLFRDGRMALLIGFGMLGICMFLSWVATELYNTPFTRLLGESLVIIGWVVMWRPAEIFLYDWTPMLRRKRLFRRLAQSTVTVRH